MAFVFCYQPAGRKCCHCCHAVSFSMAESSKTLAGGGTGSGTLSRRQKHRPHASIGFECRYGDAVSQYGFLGGCHATPGSILHVANKVLE